MKNWLKLYLNINQDVILYSFLALRTKTQFYNSISHTISNNNWRDAVIQGRLFILIQDYVPLWWSLVFPGVQMMVSQLLHGWFKIFIPQRVDDGVQQGCANSVEHRKELIHRKSAKRPYIEINARPEEKNYHCDVGS